MTPDSEWFARLTELATNGPRDDELQDAERFIAEAERLTNLAKGLLRPGAVSPAKARLMVYPAKG
jgi:hypothetical protein